MSKAYVIADLHLDESDTNTQLVFSRFLQHCQKNHIDALYILGDLFDVWVGDDINRPIAHYVADALRALSSSGVTVYFQHGNRDFLIGRQFAYQANLVLLPKRHVIQTDSGKGILLMHGDLLCTKDHTYQRYRSVVQSRLGKALIRALPRAWRVRLGKKMRLNSQRRNATLDTQKMDVCADTVVRDLAIHRVDALIHGHTHQPTTHLHGDKYRLVLGSWDEDLHATGIAFAVIDDDSFRLETFQPSHRLATPGDKIW